MMFAFPIIFLVLICGFMLGYYQFTKTALVWHVFSRTEDLATHTTFMGVGDSLLGAVDETPPAGLRGNSKGFAFSVPIPGSEFSFSVACSATPLQIPRFNFGTPPPSASTPPPRNVLQRLDRLVRSARAYANKAGDVLDPLEDIRDDAFLLNELYGQFTSKRAWSRAQGIRLVTSWAVEQGMEIPCGQQGKQVIAARAVAWNEKTKSYKKAGFGQR